MPYRFNRTNLFLNLPILVSIFLNLILVIILPSIESYVVVLNLIYLVIGFSHVVIQKFMFVSLYLHMYNFVGSYVFSLIFLHIISFCTSMFIR